MSEVALENVIAANQVLTALAEVGVPLNRNLGDSPPAIAASLARIDRVLQLRADLGQPLDTAASQSEELPALYRGALEAGLQSDRLVALLDGVTQQAAAENALHTLVGRSLIPPLILASLAYLGLIVTCLNYAPALAGMYEQVGQLPSLSARLLGSLRAGLPYWVIAFPLLLLGGVMLWRRHGSSALGWIPGAKSYGLAVRNANFSCQLRLLLENGAALADSLPLAAEVTGDAALVAASRELAQAPAEQEDLSAKSQQQTVFPPLLAWALTADLDRGSLSEILRFAERTYRQAATRRMEIWRLTLPATLGALVGGVVVLAYGLSLFLPFSQLLLDVSH
jgi:type II secretory pathway component PulF